MDSGGTISTDAVQFWWSGESGKKQSERGVEKTRFESASQGKFIAVLERCREDQFLGLPLRKVVFFVLFLVKFVEF